MWWKHFWLVMIRDYLQLAVHVITSMDEHSELKSDAIASLNCRSFILLVVLSCAHFVHGCCGCIDRWLWHTSPLKKENSTKVEYLFPWNQSILGNFVAIFFIRKLEKKRTGLLWLCYNQHGNWERNFAAREIFSWIFVTNLPIFILFIRDYYFFFFCVLKAAYDFGSFPTQN